MLRVNSQSVLVVPPFECAWLAGEQFQVQRGASCISFDVRADNDVTVIFKTEAGSRRWQHMTRESQRPDHVLKVERNYTVILGSHRNSCLKIEKDGQLQCVAENVPGSKLSATEFTSFWISYNQGTITVGASQDACSNSSYPFTWIDPEPIQGVRHVGLSAWDRHVAYRNIQVSPFVKQPKPKPAAEQTDNVPSLVELCQSAVFKHIHASTVSGILAAAGQLEEAMPSLVAAAVRHAAENFPEVLDQDFAGFCDLPCHLLLRVLQSPLLGCGEALVFDAVVRWAQHDGRADKDLPAELDSLLPCVRFPLMSDSELASVARHGIGRRSAVLHGLVAEALAARAEGEHLNPNSHVQLPGPPAVVEHKRHLKLLAQPQDGAATRFQRRHSSTCHELMYVCDGDHNGVCRFLGTALGTQQWVNPVLAGRLEVRASSPCCRSTNPAGSDSSLLFQRCSMTNARHPSVPKHCTLRNGLRADILSRIPAGGVKSSWWLLDLQEGAALACNYYTLRHDGSQDALRSWALQGSNNGSAWTDLRRHVDDTTIRVPGQYASWPLAGHAATAPYRLFRVLLTGPNAGSGASRFALSLSYVELYGYFFCRTPPAVPTALAGLREVQ